MKLMRAFLLLSICLISVYCIQLTSHKENLKHSFYRLSHQGISYYGRHYLIHRSQEYIQEVKKGNLDKIETFNTKNQEAL